MAAPGGIVQVKGNENSLEVDSLARFAVEEHNKKQNAMLDFVKVLNAKQQVFAGTMHYITLEATNGGVKQAYEAKVWVLPWQNFKDVQEFMLIGNDTPRREALSLAVCICI